MQKDARWLLWVGLAAVAATSIWIAHDSVALQPWSDTRIPLSSAIITFIIIPPVSSSANCAGGSEPHTEKTRTA